MGRRNTMPNPIGIVTVTTGEKPVHLPVYNMLSDGPGTPVHTFLLNLNIRGTWANAVVKRGSVWTLERDGHTSRLVAAPVFTKADESRKTMFADTVMRRSEPDGKLYLMNKKETGWSSSCVEVESEAALLRDYAATLGKWARDKHGEYIPVYREKVSK
jgi:hypothetical protein